MPKASRFVIFDKQFTRVKKTRLRSDAGGYRNDRLDFKINVGPLTQIPADIDQDVVSLFERPWHPPVSEECVFITRHKIDHQFWSRTTLRSPSGTGFERTGAAELF